LFTLRLHFSASGPEETVSCAAASRLPVHVSLKTKDLRLKKSDTKLQILHGKGTEIGTNLMRNGMLRRPVVV
jgi:hypothetical protein